MTRKCHNHTLQINSRHHEGRFYEKFLAVVFIEYDQKIPYNFVFYHIAQGSYSILDTAGILVFKSGGS